MSFIIKLWSLKSLKLNHDKYKERSFTTPTGRVIEGHFAFDLTRSKYLKRFSRKFSKLIPDLRSRPKDVRMSSISNEMREYGIHKASFLGQHTSI